MRVALLFTLLALATVSVSAQTYRLLPGSNSADGWEITTNATATTGVDSKIDAPTNIVATPGSTITFSLETNGGETHPFGFSTTDNTAFDGHASVQNVGATGVNCSNTIEGVVTANVFIQNGTSPCIITATVPAVGTTWWFKCYNHKAMIGTINFVAAASSSSTGGAAASSSSSAGTTTAPPKTNGTASVTMPALTVVLATITAAAIVA